MSSKNKYIVRQPIKDMQGNIIGNEIVYHGESQTYGGEENDFAAADTIYSFLTQNTDKVLSGSLNFMTFTTTLLMKKTPRLFNKGELVIQVDDSVIVHPLAMRFVEQFAKEGYKVAVNEFQFSPRYLSLVDRFDYIKINFQNTTDNSIRNIVEVAHSMNKKCIATMVDSEALYQKAAEAGVDAMEGPWAAEKLNTVPHSGGYLQSNFFRLMVAVTADEPNVEQIEQIIAMDATLTYSLLRLVNSAYFALRNRASSVQQAIMVMGLGQLRQWIYLMSMEQSGELDQGQEEFLKLSFLRATFCSELLRFAKDVPISRSDAYLMGMFSTLDYLIAAPLEEILNQVPISEEVKVALLSGEGRCGALYHLVRSYERADWKEITRLAEELSIPTEQLTTVYFKCVNEVNSIWSQLMEVATDAPPPVNPETLLE